jgi:hypothetical protein
MVVDSDRWSCLCHRPLQRAAEEIFPCAPNGNAEKPMVAWDPLWRDRKTA